MIAIRILSEADVNKHLRHTDFVAASHAVDENIDRKYVLSRAQDDKHHRIGTRYAVSLLANCNYDMSGTESVNSATYARVRVCA